MAEGPLAACCTLKLQSYTSSALLPQSPACPLNYAKLFNNCLPAVAEGKSAIDYVAFMDALRTGLITYVPVNRQADKQSAGNPLVLPSGACVRQGTLLFMVSNLQQHSIEHVPMLLECDPPAEP